MTGKPTVEELGIDVGAQAWQSSGAIQIAFVSTPGTSGNGAGDWVLMRVADDPDRRVLVYDRFEWECFVDGVKYGEFDDAAELPANSCK